MSKFWGLAGLAVIGIIIADLVIHPTGTTAGFNGISNLTGGVGNQLLGQTTQTGRG